MKAVQKIRALGMEDTIIRSYGIHFKNIVGVVGVWRQRFALSIGTI
jgi:hypothetical protein